MNLNRFNVEFFGDDMAEKDIDKSSASNFSLEINFDDDQRIVTIVANDEALSYLSEIISVMLQRGSGYHYHLDKISGIKGNIEELLIMRKQA
jgi:hypothetical protein